MALRNQSLILYGFQITTENNAIDFRVVALETPRMATLNLGIYSAQDLMNEIVRAQSAVAPGFTFTATIDRTVNVGTENRVTLGTSSSHYELLFSSGSRAGTSVRSLIGFPNADKTGGTNYTGSGVAGTILIPDFVGYNYLSPDFMHTLFGSVNVSASGLKEAVVFQIQKFWQVQFKYETETKTIVEWSPLWDWMIQQKLLDFTPDITVPNTFFTGTLEKSGSDSKGLSFVMKEMLPDFPFRYDTQLITFRQRNT